MQKGKDFFLNLKGADKNRKVSSLMWHLILKMAHNLQRFFLKTFRAIPLDRSLSTNLWQNIYTVDNPAYYTQVGRKDQVGVLLTSFLFTKKSTQLLTSPELKISHLRHVPLWETSSYRLWQTHPSQLLKEATEVACLL